MGMKKETNKIQTLRMITRKYIFGTPRARILLLPIVLSILIGKHFEIKVSEHMSRISKSIDDPSADIRNEIILYLVISLISIVLTEIQGFVFVGVVQCVYRRTLRDTFEYFTRMEMEAFNVYGSGAIQSITSRKSRAVSEFMEVLVQNLFPVLCGVLFAIFSIYIRLGPFITMIVSLGILLYSFVTIFIALWRNRMRSILNMAENAASNIVYDSLSNHEIILSFNSYNSEVKRYDESLVDVEKVGANLFSGVYILNMAQKLIFAFTNTIVVLFGVYGFLTERIGKDTLLFYFMLSRILMSNLGNLGYTYCRLMDAVVNTLEVLSEDHVVVDTVGFPITEFKWNISFNGVCFCHGGRKILEDVKFTVNRGDKVAIIGQNGSGKSTILKAFLRLGGYTGTICIDGIDIRTIDNGSFRSIVSYVPQNPTLFSGTVMYNIKYGNPDVSDYAVVDVAKQFDVHDSIVKLERGYFTNVGEIGKSISGGEKQKIAILRALMCNPEILVMDEPTSNLDKESEHNIIENIMRVLKKSTVISIVHNLELLRCFDKALFVDEGNVTVITNLENGIPEQVIRRLKA